MTAKVNVLVLGSGGREHALVWKLGRSQRLGRLFCAPGSDAIAKDAECAALDMLDAPAVASFCRKSAVGLVVVGPETPLEAGVADVLRREGVPVFGPGKAAARLETSKSFAKDFMARHKIPTAGCKVFTDAASLRASLGGAKYPLVLKADGLAQGKGVRVCRDATQALETVAAYMEAKSLGPAGETIVVEECLEGPELSVMALVDGKTFCVLPFSRDHKRLSDGDLGPNTGGMGAFAPVPVEPDLAKRIEDSVLRRALEGLCRDGLDYRGVLYAGVMLTAAGPKVLEFNCRFGDPEAQAVLPLVRVDVVDAFLATAQGALAGVRIPSFKDACVCVVMASEGYPDQPVTGRTISGLQKVPEEGLEMMVFHSGTAKVMDGWVTKGGRVLGVTAIAGGLEEARKKAYAAAAGISFAGMQYRRDIGAERKRGG